MLQQETHSLVATTPELLVTAAQAGEDRAMELLFRQFQPLIRRLLRHYQHLEIAEDLPGELYLAFARFVQDFDASRGVPFSCYLVRMLSAALHTIVRRDWRLRARELPMEDTVDDEAPNRTGWTLHAGSGWPQDMHGDFIQGILHRQILSRLIADLTPEQQYVFIRRALHNEDSNQIARRMDRTTSAVRLLYHRARQRLRQSWQDQFDEVP
jgi:RNA polymerase sigma factor (sigma-70 family)